MGEHLRNPVARANAIPQERMQAMMIGDGFAVTGISLQMVPVEDGKSLAAAVVVHGCKPSDLVPVTQMANVVLGFVGKISMDELKSKIATSLGGKWEPPAAEPAQ